MILYFTNFDEETAWRKSDIIEQMKDEGIESITVSKAVRSIHEGFFWCNWSYSACVAESETCGKFCNGYIPRNGKSGICRHWRHCYEPGDEYTLNVNGKLEMRSQ